MLTRRGFLGILAAPAIIRTAGLLMPVKQIILSPSIGLHVQQMGRALRPLPPGVYTGTMKNFLIQSQSVERAIARMIFEINDAPRSPHWISTSIEL